MMATAANADNIKIIKASHRKEAKEKKYGIYF